MRAVNLLPESRRRGAGGLGGPRPLIALGALAVVGAMGWWGHGLHADLDRARADVAAATAERDGLQAQLGAHQQARAREAAEDLRRGAIVSLASARVNWERLVRDLSAVMPRQVWLTHLKGETDPAGVVPTGAAPGTADATVPKGLHLDGFARSQRQVALLMARAASVPGLGEPRLATSEVQSRAGRSVVHFVIDIPIDQRAQDRATLTPVSAAPGTPGATP